MLKIGYFADGPWSHEAFRKIIIDKQIIIMFVCVRYDTSDESLLTYCQNYDIAYLKYENINSREFLDLMKKFNCDLFVSMSFNQIFKSEIMNIPKLKVINCHAGKLPYYRGRNVLNWALINDEKEFGITVHFVDEGIDTGDIIAQEVYSIDDNDSYATLLNKAYSGCANLLYSSIKEFLNGSITRTPQFEIHPTGFYCSQRKVGDEILNWGQSSREIFNFVRAICSPGPRATTFINNYEMKINKVALIEGAPTYKCIVGTILHKDMNGLLVKTSDSFILIVEFECEALIKVGDRFENR